MRGFTLIEMMISISVLTILLLLGVPAFSGYIENSRIRAAAEQLKEAANHARTEAIKRNAPVVFAPQGTGWQTYIPGAGGVDDEILQEQSAGSGSAKVTQSKASVQFNGAGRVSDLTNLTLDVKSSGNSCAVEGGPARCLRLSISSGGQVRLCDPALKGTDARACGA